MKRPFLEKLILPKEVCEWALAHLKQSQRRDATAMKEQSQDLRRRASEAQNILDALLLKAARTEDNLAEGFMRLARQKQEELNLLKSRIEQIKANETQGNHEAAEIIELAQQLSQKYVTLSPPQKRQIADSVFLNLRLDHVNLVADYRVPFSILAENGTRPLDSGRLDSNQRPLDPQSSTLSKLRHAPNSRCAFCKQHYS